jgi:CRISPR-associated endonuclease/helicase Cas3
MEYGEHDQSRGLFAHSRPELTVDHWQSLESHLGNVGKLASEFAEAFGAADWGRLAGMWHDLGKYSSDFQSYLKAVSKEDHHGAELKGTVDHSTAGAQHAVAQVHVLGHMLAYVIAGHHAGLTNPIGTGSALESRLRKSIATWKEDVPPAILNGHAAPPDFIRQALGTNDAFCIAFFVRMLYSCLVDADYLDTEKFLDPGKADERAIENSMLEQMHAALMLHLGSLEKADTQVNRMRAEVLAACRSATTETPGFFSLTVPTGGGKTLSSLAFALEHAIRNGQNRVIYVVPFTSIIEQNAEVFRNVFAELRKRTGYDSVLEHHSNFDVDQETAWSRLAVENWDAPLIVTTAVQFYESLFANRSSRCRKLHRIARSVVVLDEAQCVPVQYLHPCLDALKELTRNYHCSIVLCTATQPAVAARTDFTIGIPNVKEIIPDTRRLYVNLRRVEITDIGMHDEASIAEKLGNHRQVLCIVNTRRQARDLHEKIGDGEANIHRSAMMCPSHRNAVLSMIRERLHRDIPCRVIATRLVEAGVDLDFPVVFRSLTGIDSLAQAAGRCNRNGLLPGRGAVYVFHFADSKSERFVRETANVAKQIFALHEDPLSLDAVEQYFRMYYWDQSARWDEKLIMDCFYLDPSSPGMPFLLRFKDASERFQLIENTGEPVIVPYRNEGESLCEELRRTEMPSRLLARKLQRYTVQIPAKVFARHSQRNIERVHGKYAVLVNSRLHYSDSYGILLDGQDDTVMIY